MHFSNLFLALAALATSVYSQSLDSNLDDVRPGHMEDMSLLPYETQRCIKLHMPLTWTDYPKQLDLFCVHSTGTWHQNIPSCIKGEFPSDATAATSQYHTFVAALCNGYAGPGIPMTTVFSSDGSITTSTIFPTQSQQRDRYELPSFTPRNSVSKSHACLNGKRGCHTGTIGRQTYVLKTTSKKEGIKTHRLLASTTSWGGSTRPARTGARPTSE